MDRDVQVALAAFLNALTKLVNVAIEKISKDDKKGSR